MKHYNQDSVITAMPSQKNHRPNRVEPWYLTYALLGATMGGMVPILGPLLILKRFGSPVYVGLAMAAYNVGGLTAPLWGKLADRFRIHRNLLMVSLLLTSLAVAAFAVSNTLSVLLELALIQGIGASGALTLGNLFIVEIHRPEEWDKRIGWYQTFNCSGQVVGMLLAAVLTHMALEHSLLIAAVFLTVAVLPGALTPTVPSPIMGFRSVVFHTTGHMNGFHFSLKRWFHHMRKTFATGAKPAFATGFTFFIRNTDWHLQRNCRYRTHHRFGARRLAGRYLRIPHRLRHGHYNRDGGADANL